MTWGMHAVAWLELGEREQVDSLFNRSFGNAQLPFLVWTETPSGGTTNFLTGVGGFLQTVLFGLPVINTSWLWLVLKLCVSVGSTDMVRSTRIESTTRGWDAIIESARNSLSRSDLRLGL